MRTQSLVEVGGRTATGDEKQSFFCLYVCLYVCVFVTLDVQERDPTIELDKKYICCAFAVGRYGIRVMHVETRRVSYQTT